jgi:hypothetical protein
MLLRARALNVSPHWLSRSVLSAARPAKIFHFRPLERLGNRIPGNRATQPWEIEIPNAAGLPSVAEQ